MNKIFTKEILKEILHYTDLEANPMYEAFENNTVYKIFSGAKGISKSFGTAVHTIYRIVNEKNFNSIWTRNFNRDLDKVFDTFREVLSLLKNKYDIDLISKFIFKSDAIYYNTNPEEIKLNKKIKLMNFENVQSFQGLSLPDSRYYWGEIVIDEPIEKIGFNKSIQDLNKIYELQKNNLPTLFRNSVFRKKAVLDNEQDSPVKNIIFCYNIFTLEHWLIKEIHNKIINLCDYEKLSINKTNLNKLIKNKFLQKSDPKYSNGLGITITQFSKDFVPVSTRDENEIKQSEFDKENNYKNWVVEVAGFGFITENTDYFYLLDDYLFDENGSPKISKIKIEEGEIDWKQEVEEGNILGTFSGFDPGLSDNSSLVQIALFKTGHIVVYNFINDLKKFINKNSKTKRNDVNKFLLQIIQETDNFLNLNSNFPLNQGKKIIFTDNDIVAEEINILSTNQNLNLIALMASRKDTAKDKFGILNRQEWQRWNFKNNLLFFYGNAIELVWKLRQQVIPVIPGEKAKRDETIHHECYDAINAFEMSCSFAYKKQFIICGGLE